MRIGVDLGGTKTEAVALDDNGRELLRVRVSTPQQDYPGTVRTIAALVQDLERQLGGQGTVGVGIPGTIVAATGLVKNANSTWLNGQPLQRDLSDALSREVRCANDANCFAISEATDGAAVGAEVVFGVILGTGCGGGVVVRGALAHRSQWPRRGVGTYRAAVAERRRMARPAMLLRTPRLPRNMDLRSGLRA